MSDGQQAREDFAKDQQKVVQQWKSIQKMYPLAVKDLFEYLDATRALYIKYGEERGMPNPVEPDKYITIDDHDIAAYLQGARVCGMVKTYITSRMDSDVAQPIKKSK